MSKIGWGLFFIVGAGLMLLYGCATVPSLRPNPEAKVIEYRTQMLSIIVYESEWQADARCTRLLGPDALLDSGRPAASAPGFRCCTHFMENGWTHIITSLATVDCLGHELVHFWNRLDPGLADSVHLDRPTVRVMRLP